LLEPLLGIDDEVDSAGARGSSMVFASVERSVEEVEMMPPSEGLKEAALGGRLSRLY
jgi:hypothetical protein